MKSFDLSRIRVPYALRRVPESSFFQLLPPTESFEVGDIALARIRSVGKNTRLELVSGRASTLYAGDLIAVVFGNRYATAQFEGFARVDGRNCDLLSMGGLCGIVASKAAPISDPTRLEIVGRFADQFGHPLRLSDYAAVAQEPASPKTVVVCGSSMDSGKSYTARSIVRGFSCANHVAAGIKLTGTAAGRDTWSFLDAGAAPALDFIDGGWPSTYMCDITELIELHRTLLSLTAASGAEVAVIEIADGLFQRETAALLQSREFVSGIDHFMFATGDPLAAYAGIDVLNQWGIRPAAISGLISTRPLAMREVVEATGVPVLTADQLQSGYLNDQFLSDQYRAPSMIQNGAPMAIEGVA